MNQTKAYFSWVLASERDINQLTILFLHKKVMISLCLRIRIYHGIDEGPLMKHL